MPSRLANAIGYQLVWFCAVAGAGHGWAWAGPLAATCFAALTLHASPRRGQDVRLMLCAIALGALVDGAFAASGWLHYAQPWPSPALAPPWICAIWASFALTLNHSLSFLRGRPWLASALGAVGGPLAYASAARGFGALAFGVDEGLALLSLALTWALVVPLLMRLAKSPRPVLARRAAA